MRVRVHQATDLVNVAACHHFARIHQHNFAGHELHFVEDMTRDEHRLALAAPAADRVDDVAAPDGVEAR